MHWHKCKFDTQQQQQQNYKYKWITYIYVICDEFFCCCCWCGWYSFMCVQHSTVSMLRVWIIWDGFREPGHRLTKLMRIALARARTHTTHTYVIMTSTWWNVVCHNCGECIVCCTYTQPVQFHDNIILSERQWIHIYIYERRYDDVAKNSIWQHSKHCTSDNRFIRTEYVGDIYANAPFLCAKTQQQQQTKNMLSVYCVMVYIKDGKNDSHAKQRVHVCSVRLSCLLLNFCFLPVCAPFE